MIRRVVAIALLAGVIAACLAPSPADAADAQPSVALSKSTVTVGERIIVTLKDWPLKANVVISTCGNAARRGSIDCNLADSLGSGLSRFDKEHLTEFVVHAPPTTCPCVVQVATVAQTLSAYAPIELVGHPVGPVVGDRLEDPLELNVAVQRTSDGFFGNIRSWLGGPTSYVVTVQLRNRIPEELHDIRLRARAGRSANDQARFVALPPIDVLAAGESWRHRERVTLSAPVFGSFVWTVTASGAGPVVKSAVPKGHFPWLLYLLAIVFVGDVAWYVKRRIWARHEARRKASCGRALTNESAQQPVREKLARSL